MSRHRVQALRTRNRMLVALLGTAVGPALVKWVAPASNTLVNAFVAQFLKPAALVAAVFCVIGLVLAQASASLSPVSHSSATGTESTDEETDTSGVEIRRSIDGTPDPVEQAQQRYVAGEIGDLELETELEDALLEAKETSK